MITPVENFGQTRKAFVAGSFYPNDSGELGLLIDGFLSEAKKTGYPGKLKILIVPHAGLFYSGRTAARGFAQLKKQSYSKAILLGASHRHWFDYAAVFKEGKWETPLGRVAVDNDLAKSLLDENKKITADDIPHREEHCLEVELIFLQKALTDFKIVPILVGQVSEELSENLAQKISENLDEKTLLIVSTDLSHYPSGLVANEVDRKTIEAIVSGKASQFLKEMKRLEAEGYLGLETAACGQSAVLIAMRVAEKLKIKFNKIYYENSGDMSGDKSRVVGYAAIGGWSK